MRVFQITTKSETVLKYNKKIDNQLLNYSTTSHLLSCQLINVDA